MVTGTYICRIIVSTKVNNPKYIKCLAHSKLAVSGGCVIETETKRTGHGDPGSIHIISSMSVPTSDDEKKFKP